MLFKKEKDSFQDDYRVINNMRVLSLDMINKAKSGHPGICLGAATILYTLYANHMSLDLDNLKWYNRDRFVLSAGHGAPLFYSMLYMLDLISLDDVKALRQLNSITKGHPELTTPLVDMATGPLGQGIASAVGMAIAERYLNEVQNKSLINHYTYVLCGDGDLEEGISYEALSLASHLKLNKIILLYDSNNVTLDGELAKSSSEDVITRFRALNFTIMVVDGDSIKEIDTAIKACKNSLMPSIIICKTTIGKYSLNAGKNIVHGKPLSEDDIKNIKKKLDVYDSAFTISNDAKEYFKKKIKERMYLPLRDWQRKYANLKEDAKSNLDKIFILDNTFAIGNLNFSYEDLSLRDISGNILNEISKEFPLLIGGSSDVSSSCKTFLKDEGIFDSKHYNGRNIYFGIREHAMGAIMNGMALSGLRPFGSTFLVFSDYLRPAIRMSAMMNLPCIYLFTHDSITVGEDGMTHQPIEQLASLELIPNLYIYRPFDVNELLSSYMDILKNKRPAVLVLPRDNKRVSELTKNNQIDKGAYILKHEEKEHFITLVSNGEELGLTMDVSEHLNSLGIDTRIVSVPCMKNFINNYDDKVMQGEHIIGITYGIKNYFYQFTNKVIGMDTFGASGTKEDVLNNFGYNVEEVSNKILEMIGDKHE